MVNITNYLPAPDLPQMTTDNSISLNDLNMAGGVFVRIRQYEDAARGDYIQVLWDGDSKKEKVVDHLSSDFPIVVVITSGLDVGEHFINYTAKDVANNIGESIGVNVKIIDDEPEIKYPAPIFIDAVNNIIDKNSIITNAGTHIHVLPYAGAMVNDVVILLWTEMSASGTIIGSGTDSHVILAADISTGVTFLIPESKLESLQDKDMMTAYYQIRRSGVVQGISEYSKVMFYLSGGSSELSIMVSTGATSTDYDAIHLFPFNQGVVKGQAGAKVILSVVGDAVFDESDSGTNQIVLNEEGTGYFKLRSFTQGSVEVSAETMSNPGVSVQQIVRFGAYTKGNGNIRYLNYSTGAPANGLTPCSVYLKAAQSSGLQSEITMVRVTVTGSAVIDGYSGQSADILLNSDKSVEIDIINRVAETVNVELSLPESSGSINRFSLVFKSFGIINCLGC